ncbi:WXG100 family type VII secretion target [Nonomuraea sp. B12E4]|uniref:WXG100 family type VII secretion target n=1 Tax=Nonomuraea sp. B12E4 TaxID=3153564 RepID=UPI00325D4918
MRGVERVHVAEPTHYEEGIHHGAGARLALAHSNIVQIQRRLNQIPATLGAAWQGDAAHAYKAVLDEWDPHLQSVIDTLDDISEKFKGA